MGSTGFTPSTRLLGLMLVMLLCGCVARPPPIDNPYDALAPAVNAVETNATAGPPPPPPPTGMNLYVQNLLGDWGWYYIGAFTLAIIVCFFSMRIGIPLFLLTLLVYIIREHLIK